MTFGLASLLTFRKLCHWLVGTIGDSVLLAFMLSEGKAGERPLPFGVCGLLQIPFSFPL